MKLFLFYEDFLIGYRDFNLSVQKALLHSSIDDIPTIFEVTKFTRTVRRSKSNFEVKNCTGSR